MKMTNNFAQENNLISYWQKKYLMQALLVILIIFVLGGLCVRFVGVWQITVLYLIFAFWVGFVMLRELQTNFQMRIEEIFWTRAKAIFEKVNFDYGEIKTLEENSVPEQLGGYTQGETYNSMAWDDCLLEEKWLYCLTNVDKLKISTTVFKGIVISMGDDGFLNDKVSRLKKTFNASEIQTCCSKGRCYFWIKTKCRIFYQVKLYENVKFEKFLGRVMTIKSVIDDLKSVYNKGK